MLLFSLFISIFSSLDPQLQDALKEYLVAKGIGENLTNFLLLHLHKKEQGQYMNWLHKLESLVAKSEWQPMAGLNHTCFILSHQYPPHLVVWEFVVFTFFSVRSQLLTTDYWFDTTIIFCRRVWVVLLVTTGWAVGIILE